MKRKMPRTRARGIHESGVNHSVASTPARSWARTRARARTHAEVTGRDDAEQKESGVHCKSRIRNHPWAVNGRGSGRAAVARVDRFAVLLLFRLAKGPVYSQSHSPN